ncbi:unnamed protein product [Amoebophrya sp. A25]|nr:unnamed protein product [Amoebophrya sp. A25]|eukprot:GSA25T00021261001.1
MSMRQKKQTHAGHQAEDSEPSTKEARAYDDEDGSTLSDSVWVSAEEELTAPGGLEGSKKRGNECWRPQFAGGRTLAMDLIPKKHAIAPGSVVDAVFRQAPMSFCHLVLHPGGIYKGAESSAPPLVGALPSELVGGPELLLDVLQNGRIKEAQGVIVRAILGHPHFDAADFFSRVSIASASTRSGHRDRLASKQVMLEKVLEVWPIFDDNGEAELLLGVLGGKFGEVPPSALNSSRVDQTACRGMAGGYHFLSPSFDLPRRRSVQQDEEGDDRIDYDLAVLKPVRSPFKIALLCHSPSLCLRFLDCCGLALYDEYAARQSHQAGSDIDEVVGATTCNKELDEQQACTISSQNAGTSPKDYNFDAKLHLEEVPAGLNTVPASDYMEIAILKQTEEVCLRLADKIEESKEALAELRMDPTLITLARRQGFSSVVSRLQCLGLTEEAAEEDSEAAGGRVTTPVTGSGGFCAGGQLRAGEQDAVCADPPCLPPPTRAPMVIGNAAWLAQDGSEGLCVEIGNMLSGEAFVAELAKEFVTARPNAGGNRTAVFSLINLKRAVFAKVVDGKRLHFSELDVSMRRQVLAESRKRYRDAPVPAPKTMDVASGPASSGSDYEEGKNAGSAGDGSGDSDSGSPDSSDRLPLIIKDPPFLRGAGRCVTLFSSREGEVTDDGAVEIADSFRPSSAARDSEEPQLASVALRMMSEAPRPASGSDEIISDTPKSSEQNTLHFALRSRSLRQLLMNETRAARWGGGETPEEDGKRGETLGTYLLYLGMGSCLRLRGENADRMYGTQ